MAEASHTTEQRVGRGALWALAGRGLGVVATALMVAALPRFLTKEQYGAFSLLAVLAMFASVIGTLGLNDGSVRLLSEAAAVRDSVRLRYILKTGFRLTLLLATIAGLVGSLWLVTQRPQIVALSSPGILFVLISGTVLLLALQLVAAESLRGLHDIRIASVMSGGGTGGPFATLLFVGIVSLQYFTADATAAERLSLNQVLLSFLAALALTLPLTHFFLRKAAQRTLAEIEPIAVPLPAPKLVELTAVSFPLMFVHLLVFFTMNADVWILEASSELETIGLYAAARRLMLAVSIPSQIAAQATMSSIPDLAVRGQLARLEMLLRRSALISAAVSLALGGILLAFPGWVLGIVCGEEYTSAAPILVILCVGNLVVAFCGNAIHALIMTGRHFYGLVVYAIAAAILALVGPWGAQHYGAWGIAMVASSCLAFQNLVSWWLAKRYVGVWTHPGWPTEEEPHADRSSPNSTGTKEQPVPCGDEPLVSLSSPPASIT